MLTVELHLIKMITSIIALNGCKDVSIFAPGSPASTSDGWMDATIVQKKEWTFNNSNTVE